MNGRADATLPVSILRRSIALNLPRPPLGNRPAPPSGRDEVRVARERRAAGAEGAEHHLVLLERRRLQHHLDAVGQLPLGDAEGVLRRRLRDRRRARAAESRSGLRADRVDVRRQVLAGADAMTAASSLVSSGIVNAGLLRRADDDDAVARRGPSPSPAR